MKIQFALILVSALLPLACGQVTQEDIAAANDALSSMTSEEQAANDLYLDDSVDSAAEGVVPAPVDGSADETKDDVKAERLTQMAAMLIKRLDTDAPDSLGSLSLEEFLVGPLKRAEDTAANADKIAKIKAKMTEEFNKFAGEDKLLSADEIKEMLKSCAGRIGQHRQEKFPGKQEERVQKSAADLIKEFDTDKDGKLDATELEALRTAKKSGIDEFRKGRGGERGAGEQHGRRGPGKDGEGKPDDSGDDASDDSKAPALMPV